MCPVRHHCSWSQHRFKSGGSSMGFAVSKKSKKLILYCEKRRWWGIWGKLKNLCWFCKCRKILYVKWCVTVDCVNTWITMCRGEVFCKPQEACRKKPTIGDVSVSVFFSSVNDETSRNNHRLFEFEQKDIWGWLHLQFALRYSSPTFTLNRQRLTIISLFSLSGNLGPPILMAILTRVRPAAKEPPEALWRDSNQGFITQKYTLMPNVGASQYDGYSVVILKNHWHSTDISCYRPPSRTSCRSSFAAALTRNWSETKSWTLFRAPKPFGVVGCSGSSFFLWSSIDISSLPV